jgi:hypothetical protein
LLPKAKYGTALIALICAAFSLMALSALAITAEVAKKCGVLADMAYPLRVPGNPAAGRTHGSAQDVRDYFNKCVATGGNTPQLAPGEENHEDGQAPKEAK